MASYTSDPSAELGTAASLWESQTSVCAATTHGMLGGGGDGVASGCVFSTPAIRNPPRLPCWALTLGAVPPATGRLLTQLGNVAADLLSEASQLSIDDGMELSTSQAMLAGMA